MNEKIPPGNWVTVSEACDLVTDVTRRRLQALAKSGVVRSVKVLGRLLIDRDELITWRDGPRAGGRPPKNTPVSEQAGGSKPAARRKKRNS